MFPYPIILEDYDENVVFLDDLSISENDDSITIISENGVSRESLNGELKSHLRHGLMFGLKVTSSMAFYEELFTFRLNQPLSIKIDKSLVARSLELSFIMFNEQDLEINFRHIDDVKFRSIGVMNIPKYSMLGTLKSFKYWLFNERKRSVASIFKVDKESEKYTYDIDSNRLIIRIPKDIFSKYPQMATNGYLVFALYVYPVLVHAMQIVLEFRSSHDNECSFSNLYWFDYFMMQLDSLGLNESNAIIACNELLPLDIQEKIIQEMYENSYE